MSTDVIVILILVIVIIVLSMVIIIITSTVENIKSEYRSGIIGITTFIASLLIGIIVVAYGYANVEDGTWHFARNSNSNESPINLIGRLQFYDLNIDHDETIIISNGTISSYRNQSARIVEILESNNIKPSTYVDQVSN